MGSHQPQPESPCITPLPSTTPATLLTVLDSIPWPYGDNEGDRINSDSVYYALSAENQANVDHAEGVLKIYTRISDQQLNSPAISHLLDRGFKAFLGQDQYDPYRLVGAVETQEWTPLISDPKSAEDEYQRSSK